MPLQLLFHFRLINPLSKMTAYLNIHKSRSCQTILLLLQLNPVTNDELVFVVKIKNWLVILFIIAWKNSRNISSVCFCSRTEISLVKLLCEWSHTGCTRSAGIPFPRWRSSTCHSEWQKKKKIRPFETPLGFFWAVIPSSRFFQLGFLLEACFDRISFEFFVSSCFGMIVIRSKHHERF